MAGEGDAFILIIIACIFPPAAVAFVAGCGADFCLNLLLTLLGYFPGLFHACWLIIKRAEANETYGYKNWRYAGMGEYVPTQGAPPPSGVNVRTQPPPPAPPPAPAPAPAAPASAPAQGQYPASYPTQATTQAPADQKGGYDAPPPPPPVESKDVGYQATDQKSAPPPEPTDQAQVPPQAPADQK